MSLYVFPACLALYVVYTLYPVIALLWVKDVEPYVYTPPTPLELLTRSYLADEIDGLEYSFRVETL